MNPKIKTCCEVQRTSNFAKLRTHSHKSWWFHESFDVFTYSAWSSTKIWNQSCFLDVKLGHIVSLSIEWLMILNITHFIKFKHIIWKMYRNFNNSTNYLFDKDDQSKLQIRCRNGRNWKTEMNLRSERENTWFLRLIEKCKPPFLKIKERYCRH